MPIPIDLCTDIADRPTFVLEWPSVDLTSELRKQVSPQSVELTIPWTEFVAFNMLYGDVAWGHPPNCREWRLYDVVVNDVPIFKIVLKVLPPDGAR